jgi:hypothetical protein
MWRAPTPLELCTARRPAIEADVVEGIWRQFEDLGELRDHGIDASSLARTPSPASCRDAWRLASCGCRFRSVARSLSRLGALLLATLVLAAPGVAAAAPAVPGALYLLPLKGDIHSPRHVGTLRVSDDGSAITSKADVPFSVWEDGVSASYLAFTPSCGHVRERVFFALGAPGYAATPIKPDGTFTARAPGVSDWYPYQDGWGLSTREIGGKFSWIRVHGAFTRGGVALRIVGGRFHTRFADRPRTCRITPRSFRFTRQRVPSFRGGCRDAAFRTLAESATSRVFAAPETREFGTGTAAYGCVDGGSPVALGELSNGYTGFGSLAPGSPIVVAGAHAAYLEAFDPDAGDAAGIDFSLVVVDLHPPGHATRDLEPVPDINRLKGPADAPTFGRFVLTERGSVAWVGIYCASGYQASDNESGYCVTPAARFGYEVWIADAAGTRKVDAGSDIDDDSLRLTGAAVTWVKGGETRSAPIDAT